MIITRYLRKRRNGRVMNDSELRQHLMDEFAQQGWGFEDGRFVPPSATSKGEIRQWHASQRLNRALGEWRVVAEHGRELINDFANGNEVVPDDFEPELVPVESTSRSGDLFRFATLLWSVPVSQGYGRRMRFLVRDKSNGKLVGLFALMDPVFNLRVRDHEIGWDQADRRKRLYHVMDAYVLGAVPPYDRLLGGKFVALAAVSDEVRRAFSYKYRGRETGIAKEIKQASLVLVTTTSSLGRSSVYNRLKLPNEAKRVYQSVGYSDGWGHFQVGDATFELLRDWMRAQGDPYADGNRFGQGPNWRMRVIRRGLDMLGFDGDSLWHGIKREVFLAPLASNYANFLAGKAHRPTYYKRSIAQLTNAFKARWLIPRSQRIGEWREWSRAQTWRLIVTNGGWTANLMLI